CFHSVQFLYEMVTDLAAFSGSSPGVVIDVILNRMPPSVLSNAHPEGRGPCCVVNANSANVRESRQKILDDLSALRLEPQVSLAVRAAGDASQMSQGLFGPAVATSGWSGAEKARMV